MPKCNPLHLFCSAWCLQEDEFYWKRAGNTEPEQLLALEVGAIPSSWAKLDEDRALLPGNPAQHQDSAQGRGICSASCI